MKFTRLYIFSLAALSVPNFALADVSGTPTLAPGIFGTFLDLDTGATPTSVPPAVDLLWNGSALVATSATSGYVIPGATGSSVFDSLTQQSLAAFASLYSPALTVNAAQLSAGTIIAYKTKGGFYSKVLVLSLSADGSLSLRFTTFGAPGPGGPTITSIQNNYSQIPQGLPNSRFAPGVLFFIKGASLANTTTDLQSSASPGLQTTLQGVSVKVTSGTTILQCFIYYISPTQIDAVLPGNTPVGGATLTVTNNGQTSSVVGITVVASAFGILSYNGSLAAAYDANANLLTSANSANLNQAIVLWGSGVGADPSNDDRLFPQKQDNLTNIDMHAFVGAVEAVIAYRGRSQYPGVDQVVLTIPANAPTGCYVSLVIVSGVFVSNSTTIPIAASGKTCTDSTVGITPELYQLLANKGTVKQGFLGVTQSSSITAGGTTTTNSAFGTFQTTGNFAGSVGFNLSSLGSCIVFNSTANSGVTISPLDAGPAITVNSPAGGSITLKQLALAGQAVYATTATIPASFIPAAGGTFTFDNGDGGKDVQHFNAALNFPASFTWTNAAQITTVNHAQGITVNWTGGSGGAYVIINGGVSAMIGSAQGTVGFNCYAPLSAGSFTVPPWVTLSLPFGSGALSVSVTSSPALFTAPGLDLGLTSALITTSKTITY
jgi:uncharacterized protein (TIGR03437 family)